MRFGTFQNIRPKLYAGFWGSTFEIRVGKVGVWIAW